ncbi:MAG: hypothetical protein CR958_00175 [Rhodobacterales bacterium]|nr:MAG: hypothetical protein CR958_00175 [Rhodobacterales bacterium]
MANGHSEEFRRDAVRIALTSGLTRRQVAADSQRKFHSRVLGQTRPSNSRRLEGVIGTLPKS